MDEGSLQKVKMTTEQLEVFMQAAILEGRKALPHCLPNPPIGCVIVKGTQIIAKGHTSIPGKPHAEVMALNNLPPGAEGFSMFVTLEPCSFQGRTPSCAKEIIKTKVEEVYVGIIDPHTKNNGKGISVLQEAGISVKTGTLKEAIANDLAPYLLDE